MTVNSAFNNGSNGPNWLAKVGTLSILYVSVFLTRIGFGTILIIFPIYLLGPDGKIISTAVSGLVLALYPALEGLSALPVGAWVDRQGRRRAFVAGMGLITVLTLVISFTRTNIPFVGGAHALMGLSAAMVTVSSLTMITDLTVVRNRGTGMGAFDMANLVGYGVGILFGTVMEKAFASSLGGPLPGSHKVEDQVALLLDALDRAPKSTRWRARSWVGNRVPWYQLPEDTVPEMED